MWRPCKDDQGNVIRHPDGKIAQCAKSLDEVNEEEAQLPDPQPSGSSGAIQWNAIEDARFLAPSGIGGGAAVQTATGNAQFAISATQVMPVNLGDSAPLVRGRIVWTATSTDGAPLTLTSMLVDEYGWIDGVEGGRWARGTMAVNGEEELPFVLRAVDGGPPGSGQDTIELAVGSEVDGSEDDAFGYHARGSLITGDLQLQFNGDPDEQAACMERQS